MPEAATRRKSAGWTTVALGEVAINSTVATQSPEKDGFTRYIIGKHIPGDGERITTWGEVGDGEFGSRIRTIIKPGDVICTTRGPKLRVAVATFDCLSAHTNFVLRSKDSNVLLPEVLQAVACSESFQDHLRRNFRGSTNLFVNWSDAAKYEFALPPIEEQRRMVEMLKAARHATETLLSAEQTLNITYESWVESQLIDNNWPQLPAMELLDRATVGIVIKPAALYVEQGGVPALRSLNVLPNRISWDDCVQISTQGHEDHTKSALSAGDVVIVRSGRPGDAAVIPESANGLNAIDLIVSTPGKRLLPGYFCRFLNSLAGRRQFASGIAGTAQLHFNVSLFKKLLIPLAPLPVQELFVDQAEQFDTAVTEIEARLTAIKRLQQSLLEECVRP